MYIIRGGFKYLEPWQNRVFWWITGWAELIDGLVLILTLGFVCAGLAERLSRWKMKNM